MSTATHSRQKIASATEQSSKIASKVDTRESLSKKTSEAIWQVYTSSDSRPSFLRRVISILGEHFNSPYSVIAIESSVGNNQLIHAVSDQAADAWSKRCTGLLLDTRYRNLSSARTDAESGSDRTYAVLSCPLGIGSEGTFGVVCVVVSSSDGQAYAAQLQELQAMVSHAGTMAAEVRIAPQKITLGSSASSMASAKSADGNINGSHFAQAVVQQFCQRIGRFDSVACRR